MGTDIYIELHAPQTITLLFTRLPARREHKENLSQCRQLTNVCSFVDQQQDRLCDAEMMPFTRSQDLERIFKAKFKP